MRAIAQAYAGGRIEPGKVYYLRSWLKDTAGHGGPEADLLMRVLSAPVKGLKAGLKGQARDAGKRLSPKPDRGDCSIRFPIS
jgi:hypothetical protein